MPGPREASCSPEFLVATSISCTPTVCWVGEHLVAQGGVPESPEYESCRDTPTVRAWGYGLDFSEPQCSPLGNGLSGCPIPSLVGRRSQQHEIE